MSELKELILEGFKDGTKGALADLVSYAWALIAFALLAAYKKTKLRKYIILAVLIIMLFVLGCFIIVNVQTDKPKNFKNSKAENYITTNQTGSINKTRSIRKNVNFNEELSGVLSAHDASNNYNFKIPEAGKFYIKWQAGDRTSSKIIYNINLKTNDGNKQIMLYKMSSNLNYVASEPLFLPTGDYDLYISAVSNKKIPYKIVLQLDPLENIELEDNNNFSSATFIENNKIYFGSLQDKTDNDYYSFEISEPCAVNIDLSFPGGDRDSAAYNLTLYNAEMDVLNNTEIKNSLSETGNIFLRTGKYYIKIERGNFWRAGEYSLRVNTSIKKFMEAEINNSLRQANIIPVNENIYGSTGNENDVDYFNFKLAKAAEFVPQFHFGQFSSHLKNFKVYALILCDKRGNNIKSYEFLGSGKPSRGISPVRLQAGEYIIKIERIKRDEKPFKLREYTLRLVAN